ncbi:MAG TPA: FAD-dependent oxidoreductase [Rhodanobacteraceae bacterium]|nr:FAD-dependent oxidoreductase [Rhodanobacteraceae bacterium]
MRSHDLIVAGAGIIGAACAQAAAEAGLRVAVVEPGVIGGGATAAGMGHLVALDEVPAEFALARDSLRLWEAYAERPEAEFHRCGTLWVADDDAGMQTLHGKAARFDAAGIAAEWLDAAALREAEPALAHDLLAGLRVPGEAVVYPPGIARTMLDRVGMLGGTLHQGRKVVALENNGVRLDDGAHLHGPVLVACGCDTSALLPELALRPRRGHLVITDRYPGWLRHQVVETGYAASAHGNAGEAVACNVQPRPGGQLLIGSSREFGPISAQVAVSLLARMLRRCFRFLPELPRLKALRAWTGFRPATPDGLPYIGALPSRRGVWVAAGHEGLGVTTALGTAQLFADLFLGRSPRIDSVPYAPLRSPA